jgi:hypothetical protein
MTMWGGDGLACMTVVRVRYGAMARAKPLFEPQVTTDGMLADSVDAVGGKVYMQGGAWSILHTPALPTRHPRIGIAVILRFPYQLADNMPHSFSLVIVDEDNRLVALGDAPPAPLPNMMIENGKLVGMRGSFTVGRPQGLQPGDEQQIPLAANLDGVVFERAGKYVVRVKVDDNVVKELPFRINHIGQMPAVAIA